MADDEEVDVPVPSTDMDIELQSVADDVEPDPETDAVLASLFQADDEPVEEEQAEVVVAKAKTAKKAGIKRLGGQPKVASKGGESVELSSLWESAPDVNELFK